MDELTIASPTSNLGKSGQDTTFCNTLHKIGSDFGQHVAQNRINFGQHVA